MVETRHSGSGQDSFLLREAGVKGLSPPRDTLMLSNSCNNSVQPILNESSKSGIWFFQMHLETRDTELLFVIVVAQLSS